MGALEILFIIIIIIIIIKPQPFFRREGTAEAESSRVQDQSVSQCKWLHKYRKSQNLLLFLLLITFI